jgi:hypothetical protein
MEQNSQLKELLRWIAAMVPEMGRGAELLDRDSVFPVAELEELRRAGALSAVLPRQLGGQGLGTEPVGASGAFDLLRLLGRGNLAVGRVFEGHMNALRLVSNYASKAQLQQVAAETQDGHLYAIWNTELPSEETRIVEGPTGPTLNGCKSFCSAAGYATRALITAKSVDGASRMLLISLKPGERAEPMKLKTQGMRAATTGRVILDGLPVSPREFIGGADDYIREPAFSGGAWRTCAVTLGGLEALVEEARKHLISRGRQESPFQQARMGRVFIAQETVRLWTREAALIAEGNRLTPEETSAYVNLTRTAVEAATLDTLRLIQQSIGLAGFLSPSPIERIMRDLATYLRQPAPDEALTEAAARFIEHGPPSLE